MPYRTAKPINYTPFTQGTYDGKEMGRTVHRPGAYDAFSKPSLIGGKRVPYRVASALAA